MSLLWPHLCLPRSEKAQSASPCPQALHNQALPLPLDFILYLPLLAHLSGLPPRGPWSYCYNFLSDTYVAHSLPSHIPILFTVFTAVAPAPRPAPGAKQPLSTTFWMTEYLPSGLNDLKALCQGCQRYHMYRPSWYSGGFHVNLWCRSLKQNISFAILWGGTDSTCEQVS